LVCNLSLPDEDAVVAVVDVIGSIMLDVVIICIVKETCIVVVICNVVVGAIF